MPVSLTSYHVDQLVEYDNSALEYTHIEAIPLASAMGAEVRGIDLRSVGDEAVDEIKSALYRHKMLFFRGQTLDMQAQEAFTLLLGDFGIDAYTSGAEGHNVQRVVKEADEKLPMVFGGTWHTDSPFLAQPPAISMLYSVEVPPYGGDTWWANTGLAYRFLSEPMRTMIEPLRVHMSARNILQALYDSRTDGLRMNGIDDEAVDHEPMIEGSFHPLVRTHPETGERGLYVGQSYSVGIEGMTDAESTALISFLTDHIIQPIFTCRLRWEPRMLVMWDNRLTLHHAFNDYNGFRREMYRTMVKGEVPS